MPAPTTESNQIQMGTGDNNDSDVIEVQKNTVTLEILRIIKDAQQKHGLRHGDYQRYRGYCSRRLRRLRKSLHWVQGSSKHRYVGKPVTAEALEKGSDGLRLILLPLVQCERAWAHAMQLRQESNTEPRKRFHLLGRLRKAVKHANILTSLCEAWSQCDARTRLEAQAYDAWMQGALAFELQQWGPALESYGRAQAIYERLAHAMAGEADRTLFLQRLEELSPSLRYCAYNIGDESAAADLQRMRLQGTGSADLDHLVAQTREKQARSLSEVEWLGRRLPVRQEKVRLFLCAAKEAPKEAQQAPDLDARIALLERLLLDCKDAIQVVREELRTTEAGRNVGGPVSELQLLHSYLQWTRQKTTVERNLLLVQQLQEGGPRKPLDLLRPYEVIVQNLNEALQLPGVEEGSEFAEKVGSELLCYKAYRAHHVGQALAAAGRRLEAVALFHRGLQYAKQALARSQLLPEETVGPLKELETLLEGQKYSVHADSLLGAAAQPAAAPDVETKFLLDRLDTYMEDSRLLGKNPNIAPFPPDMEPIACKPLFFDLALNHIEFPSLEDVAESKKGQGLTGLVRGWLGGWKS
ncbi:signal recognition particle subunit SRP68-like [Ornithodoros turicata]|uniref:signal recognition particle subunit SRP68-like n=1 Tax=Ornithodoros turicata TaxID=34597 RepID=UPI0031386504